MFNLIANFAREAAVAFIGYAFSLALNYVTAFLR